MLMIQHQKNLILFTIRYILNFKDHIPATPQEKPITQSVNVGFVHGSHPLSTVSLRVLERVFSTFERCFLSDQLDRLDHSVNDAVLNTRVFTC